MNKVYNYPKEQLSQYVESQKTTRIIDPEVSTITDTEDECDIVCDLNSPLPINMIK